MQRSPLLVLPLVALLFSCLAASAVADENPMYRSWARYNVGTKITVRNTSEAMGQKTVTTIVTTLVEKKADSIVLENKMSMEVAGNKMDMPAQTMEIPAAMPEIPQTEEVADAPKPEIHESDDTITIAGKEYKAKKVESTAKTGGMTVQSTSWTSDNVPGMMLKSVSSVDGEFASSATMELIEVVIK
jgi:hypothetical protein